MWILENHLTRDMYVVEQYIVFDYAGSGLGLGVVEGAINLVQEYTQLYSGFCCLLFFSINVYDFLGSN